MRYSGQVLKFISSFVSDNGDKMYQINVIKARNMYDKGYDIWLHPCNMSINNVWESPYRYKRSESNESSFDSLVNAFSYCCLDKERGMRINFFARCEDVARYDKERKGRVH